MDDRDFLEQLKTEFIDNLQCRLLGHFEASDIFLGVHRIRNIDDEDRINCFATTTGRDARTHDRPSQS